MAGLVPAIHVYLGGGKDVDGRDEPGHDGVESCSTNGLVMAQLTDDCFAFSGPLLPVAEAERLIRERVSSVAETEIVPLNAVRGRVVAHDIAAPIDLPPFDNSAVDGYAVRHADLAPEGETRLTIVERVTAGRAPARALAAGEAVRIFTGAPMPPGADTVFMQEDCRIDGKAVIVPAGLD